MQNRPSSLAWNAVQPVASSPMSAQLSRQAEGLILAARQAAGRIDGSQAYARPASTDAPQQAAMTPTAGDLQFGENVPRSLIRTESGGDWGAVNNEMGAGGKKGHFGILQFGHARFNEAKAAGAIPQNMTIDQFGARTLEAKKAQVAAANWHFNDIDSRIRSQGFDRLVGQTIGGVPLSWNGMRAMAHLGGFGGLSKFIRTGGAYNPSDSYGTSLAKYGLQHRN